jgi:hypothetical protein
MKRKAIVSLALILLVFVSVFSLSVFSGGVDSTMDSRLTSGQTSLSNDGIYPQARIVEHRITTSELEKMKGEIGVYEKGRNYEQIVDGHGTGLTPPTEDEWTQIAADAKIVDSVSFGSTGQPPSVVDWYNSSWFPPIGDQDGEASCVAWAVGYYTKTFQEAKEHGWNLTAAKWEDAYPAGYPSPEYQDEIISPAFIYHLTNWGNNTGTYFYDAINLVCSIGACSWAKMPWNSSDQSTWPSEEAWREATYYRGASTGLEGLSVDTAEGIVSLKNLIASQNLAIIAVNADQYPSLTSNDVWTTDKYHPGVTNHANTIVGYDDNVTYLEDGSLTKGAFKVANSWGVGGWEHVPDGCYWISYKAMSERVEYVMFYRDRIGYVPTLTSSFRIEHPLRGDCYITIGMGTHDNPMVSKNFMDYVEGGNFSLCPNDIVFDITEFRDAVPNIVGQQFFISVYDSGTSVNGKVLYFAVEDTLSSSYTVSSDPPVFTVDGGFIFADLILGTPFAMYQKSVENNIDISSTTFQNVPDASVNFVTTRVTDLQIVFSATIAMSMGNTMDVQPVVDDAPEYSIGPLGFAADAPNFESRSAQWIVENLSAGYHTIIMHARVTNGTGIIGYRSITVTVIDVTVAQPTWFGVADESNIGVTDTSFEPIPDMSITVQTSVMTKVQIMFSATILMEKDQTMDVKPAVDGDLNLAEGPLGFAANAVDFDSRLGQWIVEDLSPGNHSITMNARVTGGSGVIGYRSVSVLLIDPSEAPVMWQGVVALDNTDVNSASFKDIEGMSVAFNTTEPVNLHVVFSSTVLMSQGDTTDIEAVVDGDETKAIGPLGFAANAPNFDSRSAQWVVLDLSAGVHNVTIHGRVTGGSGTIGFRALTVRLINVTHDVAVAPAPFSETVVGENYTCPIGINIVNQGGYAENVNVSVFVNSTFLSSQTVSLPIEDSVIIIFPWNTMSFADGNYTITVYADAVLNETDLSNNVCHIHILVTIPGDINGDGTADLSDAIALSGPFLAQRGDSNWNPNADINNDGIVDISDAIILAGNFLEKIP